MIQKSWSIETNIRPNGLEMHLEQTQVIQESALGALNGSLTFPEIVGKLASIDVERYHVDYPRQEITYFIAENESLVVGTPHPLQPIASHFSGTSLELAARQSQRNEHSYLDFIRKTTSAGCLGYFVQITGRRVIYFGRDGDSHVEYFPSAPVETTTIYRSHCLWID